MNILIDSLKNIEKTSTKKLAVRKIREQFEHALFTGIDVD